MARAQGSYSPAAEQFQRRAASPLRDRLGLPLLLLVGLLVAGTLVVTYYWAEGLWFDELGFLSEFLVRSRTQIALGSITLLASLGFIFFNFNMSFSL